MKNTRISKLILIIAILLIATFTFTACSSRDVIYDIFATDLTVEVEGSKGKDTAENIFEYIKNLEKLISTGISTSDISKINNAKADEPITCNPLTIELLHKSVEISELTDGLFDPSIFPLVELWEFDSENYVRGEHKDPPPQDEIDATKAIVGMDKFEIVGNVVTKTIDEAMLDFGGIAKGFAIDKSRQFVNSNQEALINFGGNIGANNRDYTLGVENPRVATTPYYGSFMFPSGYFASTSADFKRFNYKKVDGEDGRVVIESFDESRKSYSHIISPEDGYPYDYFEDTDQTLMSVTIMTNDGALGDALSTAIIIAGKDRGLDILQEIEDSGKPVFAILILADKTHITFGDFVFVKK